MKTCLRLFHKRKISGQPSEKKIAILQQSQQKLLNISKATMIYKEKKKEEEELNKKFYK